MVCANEPPRGPSRVVATVSALVELFPLKIGAKSGGSDASALRNVSEGPSLDANAQFISSFCRPATQQRRLALCLFTLCALVCQSTAVEMKAGKRWKRNIHLVLSPTILLSVAGPLPPPPSLSLCSPLFVSSR